MNDSIQGHTIIIITVTVTVCQFSYIQLILRSIYLVVTKAKSKHAFNHQHSLRPVVLVSSVSTKNTCNISQRSILPSIYLPEFHRLQFRLHAPKMRSALRHHCFQCQSSPTLVRRPTAGSVFSHSSNAIHPALVRSLQTPSSAEPLECHELQLAMPWGHVAAKWWGRRDVRPVLSVHGWQDNAGTFDRLIPLLPRHVGYLAIDLPGHGRSSHYPVGMSYSTIGFLQTIELIREQLGWPRLSLLAHSMGSQMAFVYAAALPDVPDMLVGIDVLSPLQRTHQRAISDVHRQVTHMLTEVRRAATQSPPPCYTHAELVERLVKGTSGSVTAEAAPYLLARSVLPSPLDGDKFYFSRDGRLKSLNHMVAEHELTLEMARKIRVPHLFVRAKRAPLFESEHLFEDTVKVLQATNPLFRMVQADGTHHIHLTNPTSISDAIGAWVCEHRPEEI